MNHRSRLAPLLLATLLLTGCAASTYKVHPGAVNATDSSFYDSLLVTHATIESTKADLVANKFPPSAVPTIKGILNGLVAAYNAADAAYLAYHQAAAAGTATQAQIDAVNAALTKVNATLASLVVAKGGSK